MGINPDISIGTIRFQKDGEKMAFKLELRSDWYLSTPRHKELMSPKIGNPKIRIKPERDLIGRKVVEPYLNQLVESNTKALVVTSPHARQQLIAWSSACGEVFQRTCERLLQNQVLVGVVHYGYLDRALGDYVKEAQEIFPEPERVIGIGMGSVCDWAKILGWKLGAEVDLLPSALSTNAMWTMNVAIRDKTENAQGYGVFGYRLTAVHTVIVDLDFVGLNSRGNISGAGDLMSGHVASTDWFLSCVMGKEKLNPNVYEKSQAALQRLRETAVEIRNNSIEGRRASAELGKDISDLMNEFGSGRPKDGSEHILSDTIEEFTQDRRILHGEQVAISTLLMAYLFNSSRLELFNIDDLRQAVLELGLPLNLDKIGLTEGDLINALCQAGPKKDRFSYFNVFSPVSRELAESAVKAIR